MIPRPFTCCCAVLAIASGFFLYTKKHQTTVLDQQISKIVSDTERMRSQTAMLRTEWALENQPERLTRLAEHHLASLHPMDPSQFVRMADLDKHLPSTGRGPAEDPRAGLVSATLASADSVAAPAVTAPVAHAPAVVTADAKPVARHDRNDDDTAETPRTPTLVADATPAHARPPIRAIIRHDVAPHMLDEETSDAPARTVAAVTRPAPVRHAPTVLAETSRPAAPMAQPVTTVASVAPAAQPAIHRTAPAVAHVAALTPRPAPQENETEQQVRHPLPVTVASWHATRTRRTAAPAAGYVEARANSSYSSGSLLERGGDALPPPVPLTN
ncbi:hypothetical protein K6W36_02425 [Acetobacter senegalensis]|uniref:cell division protein FtsL n=1 Tax=Acetobacter senegalensis TaxID=446692 RepID=UPI001EDC3B9F|nr:hypothetical protein [Acetobacter senegalensis]MCG4259441.1 hypothetical protein [Acetobacter senegalensis]